MVRFLRTSRYDQLFSGGPIWATESIGGVDLDGRTLITRTNFRVLHILYNMGPSPESNITILWSEQLPQGFKEFCAKVSTGTSSIQHENNDLMRPGFSSNGYAIVYCVSPTMVGRQMQFFDTRANLVKILLYTTNGSVDEKSEDQVGLKVGPILGEVLDYDTVFVRMDKFTDWLTIQYTTALNITHYMHNKYGYEATLTTLHDCDAKHTMAYGIIGLSVVADSLSAIKYARVKPIHDENGIAIDLEIEGEYPWLGNNDDRVDDITRNLVECFMKRMVTHRTYRSATPVQSVLIITSNVMYGKKTGNTPNGRRAGVSSGPGANPVRDHNANDAAVSLTSIAKLPFESAKDGISYTFSIMSDALGKDESSCEHNLVGLTDGYLHHEEGEVEGGQHLNTNVLNHETLKDVMENPDKYPQLTIRVSGHAVRFNPLTCERRQDVATHTFTGIM